MRLTAFMGEPQGLANALEKLGVYSKRLPMPSSPNTAHMFIVNPLSGGNLATLFSTHPPLEERICRLRGTNTPSRKQSGVDSGRKEAEAAWKNLSR